MSMCYISHCCFSLLCRTCWMHHTHNWEMFCYRDTHWVIGRYDHLSRSKGLGIQLVCNIQMSVTRDKKERHQQCCNR